MLAPMPWAFQQELGSEQHASRYQGIGQAGEECKLPTSVFSEQHCHAAPQHCPPPPPPQAAPEAIVTSQSHASSLSEVLLQPMAPSSDWVKLQQRVSALRAALAASQQTAGNYKEQVC